MQSDIHFSKNDFLPENKHVSTFRVINDLAKNQIDSYEGITMDLNDLDEYDTVFLANHVVEKNNIVHIKGSIGYCFDPKYIELFYDLSNNIIYIASEYRMMIGSNEHIIYADSYQISYNKIWELITENDNFELKEKPIPEEYIEINDNSVPYYRFPRSKDGISITRVMFNIFKVFRDENAIKPKIIIPIRYNIYRQLKNKNL